MKRPLRKAASRAHRTYAKFRSSRHVRIEVVIFPLFAASLMFVASAFGTWKAYSIPETVTEEVALTNYLHEGKFDYTAYVNPCLLYGNSAASPEADEGWSLYFTDIIEGITVDYHYEFAPEIHTASVHYDTEVVAIVTGPTRWQKEVNLTGAHGDGNSFKLSFPLELRRFEDLVMAIEEELGFRWPGQGGQITYDLALEVRINIEGDTGFQKIDDVFVQRTALRAGKGTLEWGKNLSRSQRKTLGGFSYKQQGSFAYTLKLKGNNLYATPVFISKPQDPPPLLAVRAPVVSFVRLTDIMQVDFSYEFLSDQPVQNLTSEVTITADLEFPGFWRKTMVLVPKTRKSVPFRVDFSLDINSLNELASTIKNDTGIGPPTYPLTVRAEVQTSADTGFGHIDEVFIQNFKG
ncbi:MAG: hypothetical protein ABIB93_06130, partial [Chloroflexota bacterium]